MSTRVLIADDHPFFRSGLAQWLKRQPNLTCCGEADSILSTRQRVAELSPDICLLDLQFPDGDGLDLTSQIAESHPGTRTIVLSYREEEVYAHRALRAGARGYVMKSEGPEGVAAAIHTVLRGGIFVGRTVAASMLHNLFPDPVSKTPELALLSDRELQVFQLLGAGRGTRDIAERLKISPKTVETYREHLKVKLRVCDGETLLRTAKGWVERGTLDMGGEKRRVIQVRTRKGFGRVGLK